MPTTQDEKRRRHIEAVKRCQQKTDSIMLRPYLAEGQAIRQAAIRAGQPVSVYILDAVRERMNRDEPSGHDDPSGGDAE